MILWLIVYNALIVPLGWIVFHILALFDKKVKKGIDGRKRLFETLEDTMEKFEKRRKRIWFHSSSMGEFEQAKPIIAALKKEYPEVAIIVSFFSPSGYDHSRMYKFTDVVTYIPFDSYFNAQRFVRIIQPAIAVMVRYDVWPNHVWALQRAGIPTLIANATMRPSLIRDAPIVHSFFYHVYNAIDNILTVSDRDKEEFEAFHLEHSTIAVVGDTRFDQVMERSIESRQRQLLPRHILEQKKVFVIGSSWLEDEEVVLPAVIKLSTGNNFLTLLVPHEPNEKTLERIEFMLNGKISHIRFSALNNYNNEQVIIVDSVGILMTLYQYGHVAYVGGSFAQGIHNVLEPAVYGMPLLFGPKYENSQEAVELVKHGIGFVVSTPEETEQMLQRCFDDEQFRITAGNNASNFVKQYIGATERFLSQLREVL